MKTYNFYNFYFNFPTVNDKNRNFVIHCNNCNCKKVGNTKNGFWTTEFKTFTAAKSVLDRLIKKFRNDQNYSISICSKCKIINHQFIEKYPVIETDKQLIIGTMHPPKVDNFRHKYFYGNVGSLWEMLHEIYPECDHTKLKKIQEFLRINHIGISDMIYSCDNCYTGSDSTIKNEILNPYLKDLINNSNVTRIYFTSSGNQKSALSFFCEYFDLTITETERKSEKFIKEIQLKGEVRKIELVLLLSPSRQANRSIGRREDYKKLKQKDSTLTTKKFRVIQYKQLFKLS